MLTKINMRYSVSVRKLNSSVLTAGQMAPVCSLALKILHNFWSNTSFKSVKTLRLFVCTHNNNKTWRFCKKNESKQDALSAVSVSVNLSAKLRLYLCLTDIKNISIESEMSTFK